MMKYVMPRLFLCFAFSLAATTVAHADAIYDVSVNTNSLGSGTSAAFTLIPGGAPVTNMATISDITFGGGSAGTGCPVPVQPCAQNATGDLTSSIVLNDAAGYSQFVESFSPGATLSFVVDLTTNAPSDPSLFPDLFGFTLLDSNGIPLPDADPLTGNYFSIQLDSSNPTVNVYTADASVTRQQSTVPEPGSLALLATISVPMILGGRRTLFRSR